MSEAKAKIIIEIEDGELEEQTAAKDTLRLLTFALGEESYAVAIRGIREVVRLGSFTRVPNVPDFIVGIVNLRGEIVSILDLRYFLGMSSPALSYRDAAGQESAGDQAMIILVETKGALVGLLVDAIKDTVEIAADAIEPPLDTIRPEVAAFTKGQIAAEGNLIAILDLAKIIASPDVEKLRHVT